MKWLFTILVALNIVVFAGMVAGRAVRAPESKQENVPVPQPLSKPNISVEPVGIPDAAASKPVAAADRPAAAYKPQTVPASPVSKTQNTADAAKASNCAAAVLNADDYYRIRGLLGKWQHQATRFVEANNTKARKKTAAARYRVVLSGDGEVRQRLQQQGFSFSMSDGKLSLGVFNRHGDAESLLVRAKLNGFDNAYIETESTNAGNADESSLSVAKMRVLFSPLSTQDRQDINAVIKNYSQLQQAECQKNN